MSKLTATCVGLVMAVAVLVPTVALAIGQKPGPCQVSVSCPGGGSVSCYGQTVCYYKYSTSSGPGYVKCDNQPTVACGLIEL